MTKPIGCSKITIIIHYWQIRKSRLFHWGERVMKKTILVADDEPNIRLLVKNTLAGEAYAIQEAADGREALSQIQTTQPDLVILDLMMPRCSGLDVLRELQAHPPMPKPSIIVLTAKVHEEEKVRKFGVMHFLHKPFSPLELLGVIEQTLGERVG